MQAHPQESPPPPAEGDPALPSADDRQEAIARCLIELGRLLDSHERYLQTVRAHLARREAPAPAPERRPIRRAAAAIAAMLGLGAAASCAFEEAEAARVRDGD